MNSVYDVIFVSKILCSFIISEKNMISLPINKRLTSQLPLTFLTLFFGQLWWNAETNNSSGCLPTTLYLYFIYIFQAVITFLSFTWYIHESDAFPTFSATLKLSNFQFLSSVLLLKDVDVVRGIFVWWWCFTPHFKVILFYFLIKIVKPTILWYMVVYYN